jgi:hypothetical protein
MLILLNKNQYSRLPISIRTDIFLISWGGVRLSALVTSATIWPIVPIVMRDDEYGAQGGMRISRGTRSTRKKPAQFHFVHQKSHKIWPGIEPGPPLWEAGN